MENPMDFKLRDALMNLVNDDVASFGIAAVFVTSEEKFVVFQRQYNKAMHTQGTERAANALRISQELWASCYTAS
jgi:hypothetical protein